MISFQLALRHIYYKFRNIFIFFKLLLLRYQYRYSRCKKIILDHNFFAADFYRSQCNISINPKTAHPRWVKWHKAPVMSRSLAKNFQKYRSIHQYVRTLLKIFRQRSAINGGFPSEGKLLHNPLKHYHQHGFKIGYNPHPNFDTQFYLLRNPDIATQKINPLAHYLKKGKLEGRRAIREAFNPLIHQAYRSQGTLAETWYNSTEPQVSIIVLNFNQAAITLECIDALWRHTQNYTYEIILIDNGSEYSDYQKLLILQNECIKLVRLEKNTYFIGGNNIAAEIAQGEYLVLLNNDVFVETHWLEPLMAIFQDYPDAGAAGPKFLYPNGTIQEAGTIVLKNGVTHQLGKWQAANHPAYNQLKTVPYISAATLLMKTATYKKIGGFDPHFLPGYYEDVDLCFKINTLQKKIYYCPQSTVRHVESFSTKNKKKRTWNPTRAFLINRKKFIQRWENHL